LGESRKGKLFKLSRILAVIKGDIRLLKTQTGMHANNRKLPKYGSKETAAQATDI
jgi:hypothetical protein